MSYLIIYVLFELHLTRRKFDIRATYKLGLTAVACSEILLNYNESLTYHVTTQQH